MVNGERVCQNPCFIAEGRGRVIASLRAFLGSDGFVGLAWRTAPDFFRQGFLE
jgi:hypothetical protein